MGEVTKREIIGDGDGMGFGIRQCARWLANGKVDDGRMYGRYLDGVMGGIGWHWRWLSSWATALIYSYMLWTLGSE